MSVFQYVFYSILSVLSVLSGLTTSNLFLCPFVDLFSFPVTEKKTDEKKEREREME